MANKNQWSRVNRNQNMYDNHPATEPPTMPPNNGNGNSTGGPQKPKKKKRRWILATILWL